MLYAVCTKCTFLRAFSRDAGGSARVPERCPVCNGEIVTHGETERFQPTYIGRVSLDLHTAPTLQRGSANPSLPPR